LTNLQSIIESDEGWLTINDDLISMKSILTHPDNIKLHIAADLDNLCKIKPDASSILEQLLPSNVECSNKL